MKERPMLMSAPMVRSILAGHKTQTRRVVKGVQFISRTAEGVEPYWRLLDYPSKPNGGGTPMGPHVVCMCPYGQPGDRLWVRESWQFYDWTEDGEPCIRYAADNGMEWMAVRDEKLVDTWEILSRSENYNIDNHARDRRWRPSIHMPRWASRILLEVTGVRVEQLKDISEADAKAEGATPSIVGADLDHLKYRAGYQTLWEQINGAGSWDANPWVWVIEFRRIGQNT